jgi:DNA-binding MarR family transcriptional regulator
MHAGHRLGMLLRRAYLAFHRGANAVTIRRGVTADQFVLLTVLADEDGLTQAALAERTASDPNTIAAMLRRLERRGLVRRAIPATDRRTRLVRLTAAGRRIQRRLAADLAPLLQSLWFAADDASRPHLLAALERLPQVVADATR